ncbi:hypothetical protein JCM8115_000178 [Rhodotorula mucilaginosa]|uniref:D-arabinono-1,4-lactone oxidase n=1 Tax=Rhodotorula mucilaginosa TaxID=5537 RepID=A0A9P6W740_RHOMI|nr:D-arabinono-1,4-lactone oxidase [Rhodotorula mucilaginosa]TKA58025.1 hypothetical protein B0A53_00427 [Rhodotorula sp. CCFEE 5036]
MTYAPLLITLSLALAATPVRAQYGYYGDNGTSYGVRIGVGVGIAVAVALVILIVGILLRRRRARAFKTTFPLNPQGQTQQPQGYYGQQYHGGPPQPQYGQSYTSQPASSPAVATGGYDQPPPQYAGYNPDTTSHYSPQLGTPPVSGNMYAPPNSPPPAATSQSTYYPPPAGPPPAANGKTV